MLIQLAVDRMTMKDALRIAGEVGDRINILEMGTSYIKDYGLTSVAEIKKAFPELTILADTKTCDEGEYEFRKAFEAGADIATVMGNAAYRTVETCCETAERYRRRTMIDLLECPEERIRKLTVFKNAIFCIHLSKDSGRTFGQNALPGILHDTGLKTAAAGGILLEHLPALIRSGISIAIVGSAITGAADIRREAAEFAQAASRGDPFATNI